MQSEIYFEAVRLTRIAVSATFDLNLTLTTCTMKTKRINSVLMFICGMITAAMICFLGFAREPEHISPLPTDPDSCACDNSKRYSPNGQESANIAIDDIKTAQAMVAAWAAANPGKMKGVWLSKKTLDMMFCNDKNANGIFVYNALTDKTNTPTMVAQASHQELTNTTESAPTIFYSMTTCPMICGW